jgi:hypothetical protein
MSWAPKTAPMSSGTKEMIKQLAVAAVSSCLPLIVGWGLDELKAVLKRRKNGEEADEAAE